MSDVLTDVDALKDTCCSSNESLKNYYSRFAAQMAKFNSYGQPVQLPESIYALLLLCNAGVDDRRRVSVLSAATGSSRTLPLLWILFRVTRSTADEMSSSRN